MGKEGKKKSKEAKERAPVEDAEPAARSAVSIKVLKEDADVSGCALACFSDAPPPEDLLVKGADPYAFQCQRSGRNGVRTLKGEKGRILLEGQQSQTKCCYRYLVGVYDPEKGRLEVVDPGAAGATGNVYSLKRRLRGDGAEGGVLKLSKDDAREALVDGFGSKRVKAIHKKRKGQELEDEGSEAMQSLEKTLRVRKDESVAAKAAAGLEEEADRDGGGPNEHAPPPDLSATDVSGVYNRREFLNDECWDSINPGHILGMADNPKKDRSGLPAFIARNLSHVSAAAQDKQAKKHTAKLLTLSLYLMRFHGLGSRFKHTAETLKNELGIPPALGVHFLQTLAEGSDTTFSRPQIHKDRLLLLLAVTSLLACGYDVEIDDMAMDLKMHADKLAAYFKEVGAKVDKTTKKMKTEVGGIQVRGRRGMRRRRWSRCPVLVVT